MPRPAQLAPGSVRRPRVAPPEHGPPPRALVGQIHACTALVAVAGVTGSLFVLDALRSHFASARGMVALVGVLWAAGAVAGLLVPRAVIKRRVRSASPGHDATSADGVSLEFAATLTGVLALGLAGAWTLLLILSARLDSWQHWHAQRFLHPPWLAELLRLLPVALGLVLVAAAGAMVMVALHGWQRLVRPRRARAVSVWVVALAATALTGFVVRGQPRPVAPALAALLASYGAAIAAVVRRATGGHAHEPATQPMLRPRQFWPELTGAGVAAALAGAASMRHLPAVTLDHAQAATGVSLVAGAALVGVLAAGPIARRWPTSWRVPAVLVLAEVMLLWTPVGGALLATVHVLATVAVGIVGRRLSAAFGRAPPALAWVGAAGASGYGFGLLAGYWLAVG